MPMFSPLLYLVATVAVLISSDASAQCQIGYSPDKPRQTTTKLTGNLPLETPITLHYKGDYYRIKLGYLIWWGTPKSAKDPKGYDLEGVKDFSQLSYYFWMPDLRYSEKNEMNDRSFRPCENGRPPTTPDQPSYIVKAYFSDLREGKPGVFITPQARYERWTKYFDEKTFITKQVHGLVKFVIPGISTETREKYRKLDGGEFDAYIECTSQERAPNAGCYAYIYYPRTGMNLMLAMPANSIAKWKDNLDAVMRLYDEWRVKDKDEIARLDKLRTSRKDIE